VRGHVREALELRHLLVAHEFARSDSSNDYDLEDVVFPNVEEAFNVQSGESVVLLEPFDEKWTYVSTGR